MRTSARAAVAALLMALLTAACGEAPAGSPGQPQAGQGSTPVDPAAPTPTEPPAAPTATDAAPDAATAPDGATASTDSGCGPVEHPAVQGGSHLIGDAEPPGAYSSTPPTSGWHSSGAMEVRIHDEDDPLGEPQQVTVLEADGVVITYRDLPADQRDALEQLVRDRYDGQVALTPYEKLDRGEVALTAWGALQRCDGVHVEAITEFLDAHVALEVNAGHQH